MNFANGPIDYDTASGGVGLTLTLAQIPGLNLFICMVKLEVPLCLMTMTSH